MNWFKLNNGRLEICFNSATEAENWLKSQIYFKNNIKPFIEDFQFELYDGGNHGEGPSLCKISTNKGFILTPGGKLK